MGAERMVVAFVPHENFVPFAEFEEMHMLIFREIVPFGGVRSAELLGDM